MYFDAADQRIGWIEDHFVSSREARGNLNRTAEVVPDGDRHEFDPVTADDADAKALGTEQQSV